MTANDNKSYLVYLNKLPDAYNTYHHFIDKKPINADYSALLVRIETTPEAPKFKLGDKVKVIKDKEKNIFNKGYTENWSRKIFLIILCWKLILGPIKSKI